MKKLVILGGGTSGWMAAAALSNAKPFAHSEITLIESKAIGTIGVGEGSTPYLKRFMHNLGFDEAQWMAQCDATFKTGIKFTDWNGDNSHYFHPFYNAMDVKPAEIFFNFANARRRGQGEAILPNDYFVAGQLAQHNYSPKTHQSLPVEPEYGYHFDAGKLAKLLKQFAISKGVNHIENQIKQVEQKANGDISQLITADNQIIKGDFFIDASGFAAELIGKTLAVKSTSFTDDLLNNAAVAVSLTPEQIANNPHYVGKQSNNFTESKALSAGWMWQIPLTTRMGNGYVYSNQHLSAAQAEQELAAALGLTHTADLHFKHINMPVGVRETPWCKNVLAIGLAHSFVEPLEATALMVTQWTIEYFIKLNQQTEALQTVKQDELNKTVTRLIYGIKDYIVAHYVTSKKQDTPYWQQVSQINKASPRLKAILTTWLTGQDIDAKLYQLETELAYFRPSWYALLAGMDYRDANFKMLHNRLDSNLLEQAKHYCQQLMEQAFIKSDATTQG